MILVSIGLKPLKARKNIFIIAFWGGRVHLSDIPTQTNAGLGCGYN